MRVKIPARPIHQQGVVLIVALIFMAVLTILGLSVVLSTTDEEKIARNFRDMDIAFAAAEAGIRGGELRITGTKFDAALDRYGFNSTCANGLCDDTLTNAIDTYDFFGSSAPGKNSATLGTAPSAASAPAIKGVATQPRYMIQTACRSVPGESATSATCQTVYKITAKAKGISGNTIVVLQEMFVP
jgi:type IV pilus assembly protein PilX